jgi:hypothetical protein
MKSVEQALGQAASPNSGLDFFASMQRLSRFIKNLESGQPRFRGQKPDGRGEQGSG